MSTDPIALDTVFCHLVNLDPSYVPTNLYGETLGLGTWHDDRIEIVTADGTISEEEHENNQLTVSLNETLYF